MQITFVNGSADRLHCLPESTYDFARIPRGKFRILFQT